MLLWCLAASSLTLTALLVFAMRRFTERHAVIDSRARLHEYQRFVVQQMWGTLSLMALIFMIPVAVIGDELLMGPDAPSSLWPIMLAMLPVFFRKQIREAEQRCRSIHTVPTLQSAYDAVNKVWVDRALPRFATLPPGESTRPTAHTTCATHGDSQPAATCTRCGNYRCLACAHESVRSITLCTDCEAHFRTIRSDGFAGERSTKIAGNLLTALGTVELCVGAMMVLDGEMSAVWRALGLVVGLTGVLGFTGGTLWTWNGPLGRKLSMLAALLHLPVLPVGTLVAIYALVVGTRHGHVTTPGYREAIRNTSKDDFNHQILGGVVAVGVVFIYIANVAVIGMAAIMSSPPT